MRDKTITWTALACLILLFSLSLLTIEWDQFLKRSMNNSSQPIDIIIKSGMSAKKVAKLLHQHHAITNQRFFLIYVRLYADAHAVQAGEYRITPDMPITKFVENITRGKVVQHSFTLVDGWTFKQTLQALAENKVLQHQLTGLSDAQIMYQLGLSNINPEGEFFPDTYNFTLGMSDADILKRAHVALVTHLDKQWATRSVDLPYKSSYQALIVASMVEKEAKLNPEKPLIASVIIKRLQKRMKLQIDSTVIYGLGDSFTGKITRRDLRTKTPYNTYVHYGLPPTPIAMPGLAAIQAATHPAKTNYLYFVAKGDGSHYFSASLALHNKAVAKYQLHKNVDLPQNSSSKSTNDSDITVQLLQYFGLNDLDLVQ